MHNNQNNRDHGCRDMRPRCGVWCLIRTIILLTITFAAVFLWYNGLDKKAVMARLTGPGAKSKFKITTVEVETNQSSVKPAAETKAAVSLEVKPEAGELAETKPPEVKPTEVKPVEPPSTSSEPVAKPPEVKPVETKPAETKPVEPAPTPPEPVAKLEEAKPV